MSIAFKEDKPEIEQKGGRANFRWRVVEPWDERRLAAFLMTKHRRDEADWTRRSSPFFASLGQSTVECSIPAPEPRALPQLEKDLTTELRGILAGADGIHEEMITGRDWRKVSPP